MFKKLELFQEDPFFLQSIKWSTRSICLDDVDDVALRLADLPWIEDYVERLLW